MHNLGVTYENKMFYYFTQIIDAYQTHLALRIGHDRHLCPAWRSKYLVDRAKARDNPKPSTYNMDSALSRAGAVRYVLTVGERSNFKKFPTHTQDHGDA